MGIKTKNDWEAPRHPWIGVDMDGTLAHYDDKALPWNIFGPPIPRMVERIQGWLLQSKTVIIVTARVFPYIHGVEQKLDPDHKWQSCLVTGARFSIENMLEVIGDYTERHVGQRLAATCAKDYRMLQLWDDRAVQVIPNTGRTLHDEFEAMKVAQEGKAQG
jgi:hydroxymethylpyrimidine pyrophosphatase-like HAD family hydrolase